MSGSCDDGPIQGVLEALLTVTGYDFRDYARGSVRRRLEGRLDRDGVEGFDAMRARILRDRDFAASLIGDLAVPATEMFRDPVFFRTLREQVAPILSAHSRLKIWVAGCSSGEEAYSLAIVLEEAALYERSRLYVTDMNPDAVRAASAGVYRLDRMQSFTRGYQESGGRGSFSSWYHAAYGRASIAPSLRRNMIFSRHNLVSDGSFGAMHLIACRNVLIYFDRELRARTLALFAKSLVPGGFLCLGAKEGPGGTDLGRRLAVFSARDRIYRLRTAAPAG